MREKIVVCMGQTRFLVFFLLSPGRKIWSAWVRPGFQICVGQTRFSGFFLAFTRSRNLRGSDHAKSAWVRPLCVGQTRFLVFFLLSPGRDVSITSMPRRLRGRRGQTRFLVSFL